MSNLTIFIFCSIIWSTNWLGIHFQIGDTAPACSVCYRFAIAASILLAYCYKQKLNLNFSLRQHLMLALQGICMFCLNFILFYYGSMYLVSGLVAIAGACIILMNILNSKILLQRNADIGTLFGAMIGICGIISVFSGELMHVELSDKMSLLYGLLLCITASYAASFGQVLLVVNHEYHQIEVIPGVAIAMLYGTVFAYLIALINGNPLTFDMNFNYISSLAYLSLVGSVMGFILYSRLIVNIGPAKSGYIFVLPPVVSLVLSSWVEHFTLTSWAYLGICLVLLGNWVVLRGSKPTKETA